MSLYTLLICSFWKLYTHTLYTLCTTLSFGVSQSLKTKFCNWPLFLVLLFQAKKCCTEGGDFLDCLFQLLISSCFWLEEIYHHFLLLTYLLNRIWMYCVLWEPGTICDAQIINWTCNYHLKKLLFIRTVVIQDEMTYHYFYPCVFTPNKWAI